LKVWIKNRLKKHRKTFNAILSVYHFFKNIGLSYYIFRIFPVKSNKIVFNNFNGNDYGDSPKYIAEELISQNVNCKMIWLLKKEHLHSNHLPEKVIPVRIGSFRAAFELASSKIWISNVRLPLSVKKRDKQYYIQTWHGAPALKRVEKDVEFNLDKRYIQSAKADSQKINLFLSNCRSFSKLIRSSFWYEGEILECGLPRNDILFDKNEKVQEKVRSFFGIPNDVKIILYAPTFRVNQDKDIFQINVDNTLSAIESRFQEEWIFMARLHPNIDKKTYSFMDHRKVVNATYYSDLQELLRVVDIVITDYSSIMFDFAIRKLPVFLFTPDLKDYKKERNFYFSFDELPFLIAENNEELAENIKRFDLIDYHRRVSDFFSIIESYEQGQASKIVVNKIFKDVL
jgi:CDP-glycerol glycerophosphotransferase